MRFYSVTAVHFLLGPFTSLIQWNAAKYSFTSLATNSLKRTQSSASPSDFQPIAFMYHVQLAISTGQWGKRFQHQSCIKFNSSILLATLCKSICTLWFVTFNRLPLCTMFSLQFLLANKASDFNIKAALSSTHQFSLLPYASKFAHFGCPTINSTCPKQSRNCYGQTQTHVNVTHRCAPDNRGCLSRFLACFRATTWSFRHKAT